MMSGFLTHGLSSDLLMARSPLCAQLYFLKCGSSKEDITALCRTMVLAASSGKGNYLFFRHRNGFSVPLLLNNLYTVCKRMQDIFFEILENRSYYFIGKNCSPSLLR